MSDTQLLPLLPRKKVEQQEMLPRNKREENHALLCAMETAQLAGKISGGILSMHSPPSPFGGIASGLRRVAARLEVLGTDNVPDMKEYPKGELNWTDKQRNQLEMLFTHLALNNIAFFHSEGNVVCSVEDTKQLFFPSKKPKTIE